MIKSKIENGYNAQKLLFDGVKKISGAVKMTLGPNGKNVILEQGEFPIVTNDGYTIAKNINLENKFENMGAKLILQASEKTNDDAGDGTTTSCVLAEALISEGLKSTTLGVNAIEVSNGMKKACNFVCQRLDKMARKISDRHDIKKIATISCQNEEIGELITSAFDSVGKNGVIMIEDGNGISTTLEIVNGLKFDKGFVSSYFSTNTEKQICEMDNVSILVCDYKIENINQIIGILETSIQNNLKLAIIAPDFNEEVIATLVMNKLRGSINIVAIKTPPFSDNNKDILEDLCLNVGANLISKEKNLNLENITLSDLGKCKKLTVTASTSTIIEGCGDNNLINQRITQIEELKKKATSDFDKKLYTERIAKLKNSVAIIKVGGLTDVENTEKKLRIEDALSATRSAIAEGVVIGGGCALIKCKKYVQNEINNLNNNEKIGAKIVLSALEYPLRQIARNGNLDDGVILEKIESNNSETFGFNALTNTFGDLEEFGIIDPKKVTRCALQNAVSVASTLLTSTCAIINEMEK